ncbi:MAG: phage tail protein [Candidatus Omnitrophica bacterium]|nr:hypothetical protein [Methanocellales archaeon]MDD5353076.1 phage tail protein [Candidatus Omnitrophota bacterium]
MSISSTTIARVTGVNVEYKNFNLGQALYLPQRIAVIGQGNTLSTFATTPVKYTKEKDVADAYGYGSQLHLVARQLLPSNGNGIKGIPITFYPLDDAGTGVVADGNIGCTGTSTAAGSGYVYIGGIKSAAIAIPTSTAAATALGLIKTAIAAIAEMPVVDGTVGAGVLPITCKWKGVTGNKITIDISELSCAGLTFTTSAMANGANNPLVSDALAYLTDVWETIILNCMNYDDAASNLLYHTAAEARWGQTVKRPFIVATGCVDNFATRTAVTDSAASKLQRCNFLIQSTGSREMPWVIAAQGLVNDIATIANSKPAMNYIGALQGLQTGADNVQETNDTQDAAMKLGASTNAKAGSLAVLANTVSFYHPTGEDPPAYRYICDQIKLMNVVYNLDVIMETLRGKPLLPDGTPTKDPDAVQPKNVITLLSNLADSLASGRSAIISDAAFTKTNMTVAINSTNPNRIDVVFPVKLSGNVEISSTDVYFGFYFGA